MGYLDNGKIKRGSARGDICTGEGGIDMMFIKNIGVLVRTKRGKECKKEKNGPIYGEWGK